MQHAIGFMLGGMYYGAKATINVWRSDVEVSSEFSLSQIWILGGAFNSGLNTIEAGWQVPRQLLVQSWNVFVEEDFIDISLLVLRIFMRLNGVQVTELKNLRFLPGYSWIWMHFHGLEDILQVSPELYGDNNPRLFTYWTVCVLSPFFILQFLFYLSVIYLAWVVASC